MHILDGASSPRSVARPLFPRRTGPAPPPGPLSPQPQVPGGCPVALAPVPSVPPLVVIAHDDPGTADSLRHAVESAVGWQVLMADPSPAGLTAALASGPSVALVGCAALANLPSGCRTPLIAVGDDDRPGDVRAALAAGARSLLSWPDGVADLPGELARLAVTDLPGPAGGLSGLVVAA